MKSRRGGSSAQPRETLDAELSSGGGDGSYKALGLWGLRAQSILNSLLLTLLASLANVWNWLASRLKDICSPPDQQSTFCATSVLPTTADKCKIKRLSLPQQAESKGAKTSPSDLQSKTNPDQNKTVKMTIEVSAVSEAIAKVKPGMECDQDTDQGIGLSKVSKLAPSLPALRLNSESFEEMQAFSEEDESSSSEINSNTADNDRAGHQSEDSCSDYCSGSGSPVPQEDEAFEALSTQISAKEEEDKLEEDEGHNEEEVNDADAKVSTILVRRDSDTSESSEGGDVPVPQEVQAKILTQVEAMFSDDHLAKDGFLLKHVRRRSDGFVSLKLVAGLRKVKQISRDFPVILGSLKHSEVLEVNPEGTKIRRKEPLTTILKSLPIKQAKKEKSQAEKENLGGAGNGSSADEQIIRPGNENFKSQGSRSPSSAASSRRNSSAQYGTAKGPVSRKNSNVSTCSSTNMSSANTSRNGSFSTGSSGGRPHPADLFRHVMNGLGAEEVVRRGRGGSLPISASQLQHHRGSISGPHLGNLSSSPPNAAQGYLRPKSNSYCEGTTVGASGAMPNGMSPWLLRRKASVASSRLSTGELVISGAIRQPRGPDGTKGFQSGYRAMILEERLQSSTCSA